jgi:hypothetical protein
MVTLHQCFGGAYSRSESVRRYAPADRFDVAGQPYATIVFTTPEPATTTGPESFTLEITRAGGCEAPRGLTPRREPAVH